MAIFKFRNNLDKKAYERALAEIEKKNKLEESERETRLRPAKTNIVDTAERYNKISELDMNPIVGGFQGGSEGLDSSVQRYHPARNFDLDASAPTKPRNLFAGPRQRMASTEVVDIASYQKAPVDSESEKKPSVNFERPGESPSMGDFERGRDGESKKPSYFDILMGDIARRADHMGTSDDDLSEMSGAEGIPHPQSKPDSATRRTKTSSGGAKPDKDKNIFEFFDNANESDNMQNDDENLDRDEFLRAEEKPETYASSRDERPNILKVPIQSSGHEPTAISIKTSMIDSLPVKRKSSSQVALRRSPASKPKYASSKGQGLASKKRKKRIDIDIVVGSTEDDII